MFERQLSHLAGADDQDDLVVKAIEYLANIVDGDTGNRDVAAADPRFGADALGGLQAVLKECVQCGSRRSFGPGQFIRLFDLAHDLALSEDEAVEAGSDPKEMACRGERLVP